MGQACMKRRHLMAVTTGLIAAGSAGCSFITGLDEDGMELGGVTLLNSESSIHEFDVRIEKDGERIHETRYTVDGESFESLGCDWGASTGSYVIAARIATGEWDERDVTAGTPDGECRSVIIEYDASSFDIRTGMNCEFGCQ